MSGGIKAEELSALFLELDGGLSAEQTKFLKVKNHMHLRWRCSRGLRMGRSSAANGRVIARWHGFGVGCVAAVFGFAEGVRVFLPRWRAGHVACCHAGQSCVWFVRVACACVCLRARRRKGSASAPSLRAVFLSSFSCVSVRVLTRRAYLGFHPGGVGLDVGQDRTVRGAHPRAPGHFPHIFPFTLTACGLPTMSTRGSAPRKLKELPLFRSDLSSQSTSLACCWSRVRSTRLS